MSETDTKVEALLARFETDLDQVEEQLRPLLDVSSIDDISAAKPAGEEATPYALAAYALSSLLFAYLRSEGEDTKLIMPELGRIKEKLDTLGKAKAVENKKVSKNQKSHRKPESKKAANKHTRFEESEKSNRVTKPKTRSPKKGKAAEGTPA